MRILMEVTRVRVFLRADGTDQIEIWTPHQSPVTCDVDSTPTVFTTEATRGTAIQWVRDVLGVEPEIFNPYNREV